jgi:hypothetical protein
MHGMDRGGTSRDAKIINNIFYDCGEAAIDFPTRDNTAEGNLYVRMSGGYLRVMYPEPEVCLNLPAWKEFCGFDREGQNAWFDIELDGEGEKAVFREAAQGPAGLPSQLARLNMVRDPGEVRKVTLECRKEAAGIIIDRLGKDVIMQKIDDEHLICVVDVAKSKQFEGWLFSLAGIIKITAPADVADAVKNDALRFASGEE